MSTALNRRLAALEAVNAQQEAPPSPIVIYTPGEPMPPAPQGVPVVFYLPDNGR